MIRIDEGGGPDRVPSRAGSDATPPATAAAPASTSIEWHASAAKPRERARQEGRLLLVYVRAGWAVAALEMDRGVWRDRRVGRAMTGVVGWRVDVSAADEMADAQVAELKVTRVPTVLLLEPEGRELGRIEGGADADAVLALLARAAARRAPTR